MIIYSLLLNVLLLSQSLAESPARGLVYYPPYNDPFADSADPCSQLFEWKVSEGTFIPPKPDTMKDCRGTVNNIPFIAPKVTSTSMEQEAIEDYWVDLNTSPLGTFNMDFTCKDQSGRVKTGLYYWVYIFKKQGFTKTYSYQSMMSWDTEGKLLFQPTESQTANISCRFYDSAKGYMTPVRTWRISFKQTNFVQSNSVQIHSCNTNNRPVLSSNREVNVVVTSNRLEFYPFCPVYTCKNNPINSFEPVDYTPRLPKCEVNSRDPASYQTCYLDPPADREVAYSCRSPVGVGEGSVKINVQSGARFVNDEDFKPLYFKEDDRDSALYCTVDPKTAPDSVPQWEFLSSNSYGATYQPLVSSLYKQLNEISTGRHRLIITTVKPEHEGSYRCVIPQSSRIVAGGKPIYGYYFVKVYGKPQCTPYDGASSQPLMINGGAVNIDLRLMSSSYITMQCSQSVVTTCPNDDKTSERICEPVAVLRKDGQVCAMSNATTSNFCGGTQNIKTSQPSPGLLRIDVSLNNNGGADASVIENIRGSYVVQLVYPAPASLSQDVPFTINAAPPTPTNAGSQSERQADGGLWWIVLIVAGVILIVLILFVIGYCLRQSGQTYPVDKKERDAGHDPVKELKDAGFTDFSAQPAHGGSEPSLTGSVKVPEDTDSLGEYGEIDPTKFNEDGSFIHQYGPGGHPASAVAPGSALGPRISNSQVPLQQVVVPPVIPGPPSHHRNAGPAPPPRPERSAASRQALPSHHVPSGGTNV